MSLIFKELSMLLSKTLFLKLSTKKRIVNFNLMKKLLKLSL